MTELNVYEDGAQIEVDLNGSGDWAPAVVVNYHKDSESYDIMLLETNVSKTNIPADKIRRMIDEDPSSPRSPRVAEKNQRMDSVDEYPALAAEADDAKEASRSNTPANGPVSRSNSPERTEKDDRKRKNPSPSPEKSKERTDDREKGKQQFEYRPQRSKIPFDITQMSYEQYCAKHYQFHIERYQADRAAGLIPPAPMYYPPGPPAAAPYHMMPPPAAPHMYHHPPPPHYAPYGQPPVPAYGQPAGYPPRGYGGAY